MDRREQWLLDKIFGKGAELNYSEVVLQIAELKGGLQAGVNLDAVSEALSGLEEKGLLVVGYRVPSSTRRNYSRRNCFIKPQKTWRKND